MAAADRTNNTEQLQRFTNNLWQHQQKNEFCDFTLTTNNTSIKCHKLVLSSASSYFSQLLCDSEHSTNIIDVTPLPEHILRIVVAFMYNSEYVIDDDNVIELLKLSRTWNLDILAKLCVTYMNDNITINNACKLYNFSFDNLDQDKLQIVNKFIREHYTRLYDSGQITELSLKSFTTIIQHDEINVKNEDVIFSSAVQIINQQSSVEDINRCLELIRFPHTSKHFFREVIHKHPLMKDPPRDRYVSEVLLYHQNRTSAPEVRPPRYWQKDIYCIGKNHCLYYYVSKSGKTKCTKALKLPGWVDEYSSVALHGERMVIVGGKHKKYGDERGLLLDMTDNTAHKKLPDLPEPLYYTSVVLSDKDVYVVGGLNFGSGLSSIYYLSFGSNSWETKTAMPYNVNRPLVIQHHKCIYLMGGCTSNTPLSSVAKYNIKDDTWKRCNDMPVGCSSHEAGVVVHEDRIKVFTVDKCLMYVDDTDTWTVKQYNKLGDRVNAFVKNGQIWASEFQDGVYGLRSYDDEHNVWTTEHWNVSNAGRTRLFC